MSGAEWEDFRLREDGLRRLPNLPPDMALKRDRRRALARRAVVIAVSMLAQAPIFAGWYYLGAQGTEEHYEDRIETLVADRDYYRQTVGSVRDTWERRDMCEAEMRAAVQDPEIAGVIPAPELRPCYAEQEARVDKLNARGVARADQ